MANWGFVAWTKDGKPVEGTCANQADAMRQVADAEAAAAAAAEAVERANAADAVRAVRAQLGRAAIGESIGAKIFAAQFGDYELTAADLAEAAADDWAKVVLGVDTPEKLAVAVKEAQEAAAEAAQAIVDKVVAEAAEAGEARKAKRVRLAEELEAAPLPDYMRPCAVCRRAVIWTSGGLPRCPDHK